MPYNPRIMALDLASRTPARDRYVYALYASGQLLPCYIGVGKGNRLNQHWINAKNDRFRGNLRKHRTLRACWLRGIDVRAEKIAVDLTIDQAGAIERFLIDCYGRRDLRTGCLLNASAGGFGTRNFAPSTRARLAEAGRRHMARPEIRAMLDERKATPEARSKLIEANRRRPPPSIESREKMAEGCRRKNERNPESYATFLACRRPGGNRGCKQSAKARIAISASLREQWKDPQLRAARSATFRNPAPGTKALMDASRFGRKPMLGKKHSPETRAKMSAAHRARLQTPQEE
ncbi:NUMOD3 domain-containing DNA-binding protein [Bradyrhizobium sp. CCGUVB1N3]|uniref:NUMOD3 domain-containing DNA-binding protein n=1 Tax=Bradyrhizobium sp. CCGUVB1N3 TaxID=2949629 RepID=UPI0020B2B6D3|nr:NUMOD3 domain-containing DNA-binding protein [Bradyrhizobium sp. CCGUVB1N3]MCP3472330.1 NUMOD3 domain-containing DNA-binding protein [Bradyrhizobium sp. CCGUVB1N3]